MAHTEDVRKRAAEEKKLRIDHSDVYLENDKLTEELCYKKEDISRKRHRQAIHRDHEIKELREHLAFLTVAKTVSAVNSLRPHTSPAPRSSSSRRLKPPPVIVKLDVKVPSKDDDSSDDNDSVSSSSSDSDTSDASSGYSDEDPERRAERIRRRQQRRRTRPPSSVLLGRRKSSASKNLAENANNNGGPKKVTRQQLLLNQLDMEAIPPSWYMDVHQPADIPLRRATSAHPAYRPSATTTTTRRPKSESAAKTRQRRVKSAFPVTSAQTQDDVVINESALFCGSQQQQQTKKEGLSRRQIMELTGIGRNARRPCSGPERHRVHFLEAVRMERGRLDNRVKTFLESCDEVSTGGLISTRKTVEYQSIVLPESFYV